MTDTTVTPVRLWKRMTSEQRLRASQALWKEQDAASEQAEAITLIAKQWKLRPKSAIGLDPDRRTRYLATLGNISENLAARLLVLYHLAEQRPMMSAFLDAAGIQHDNGLIHEETPRPEAEKVVAGAEAIAKSYPAADVSLYLNTLLWQDAAAWGALVGRPEADAPPAR
jgi:hypothetical protein